MKKNDSINKSGSVKVQFHVRLKVFIVLMITAVSLATWCGQPPHASWHSFCS